MTRRRKPRAAGAEDGTLTLFTAIVVIGLLAAVAFIADAGQKLAAAAQAQSIAQQAARAGAAEVNTSAAYASGGTFTVDAAQAAAAARAYLAGNRQTGTVTVTGAHTVTVTVTVTKPAVFGQVIGIGSLSATESASADLEQGITGPQDPP
jgi:Flp pilus assembly protein TadG